MCIAGSISTTPRSARRCALAIAVAAIAAVAPSGALAQPAHQVRAAANEVQPTPYSITFTNPLGRSRGPGAGGGLL
jgi:hypothetical protein